MAALAMAALAMAALAMAALAMVGACVGVAIVGVSRLIWLRASQRVVSFVSGLSPSICVTRLSFIHSVCSWPRCCSTLGS